MPEHKYIFERFERRTLIKGAFKGKFIGYLDQEKSDEKHERFFDLEILDGEIFTTQDNLTRWSDGSEAYDQIKPAGFVTRMPGEIRVTLQYLDNSLRHFRIGLKELRLIRCQLSNQIYKGNEVMGTIEGYVAGYILHYDALLEAAPEYNAKGTGAAGIMEEVENGREPQPAERSKAFKRLFNLNTPNGRPLFYSSQKHGCLPLIGLPLLLVLFLGSGMLGSHWLMFLLLLVAGLLIVSPTYNWLTKKLNLPPAVRMISFLLYLLFVFTILFTIGLYIRNKRSATVSQSNMPDTQYTGRQNADSFARYFDASQELHKQRNYDSALQVLDQAASFASPDNRSTLTNERSAILSSKAGSLIVQKQYREVIPVYSALIQLNSSNPTYLYNRAVAYNETGQVREAVADLKRSIAMGDRASSILHDKINPIERKIVDYVTLCRDGTTTRSKGRGTCSHHGGILEENYPVYAETRKYE